MGVVLGLLALPDRGCGFLDADPGGVQGGEERGRFRGGFAGFAHRGLVRMVGAGDGGGPGEMGEHDGFDVRFEDARGDGCGLGAVGEAVVDGAPVHAGPGAGHDVPAPCAPRDACEEGRPGGGGGPGGSELLDAIWQRRQAPKGYCGATLFVGEGGHITCSMLGCPKPTAVDELLNDPMSTEHVVLISEHSFGVVHPLFERDGTRGGSTLDSCPVHEWLGGMAAPPVAPGRYVVSAGAGGGFKFTPIVSGVSHGE